MAVCDDCGREMTSAASCAVGEVELADGLYRRVVYGGETDDWGARSGRRCHDCNVEPGGFHHPGCDVERCPRCGAQQITCECRPREEVTAPVSYALPEVLEPCARKLWEAAQVPGCRRAVMTFKVPRGLDQAAAELRIEVDEDGEVVLIAERDRLVILNSDGTVAASG